MITWKTEHFLLLTFFENLNFENNDILFNQFSNLLTRTNHSWLYFFKPKFTKVFLGMSLIWVAGRC
jgi:hypothetical protein